MGGKGFFNCCTLHGARKNMEFVFEGNGAISRARLNRSDVVTGELRE